MSVKRIINKEVLRQVKVMKFKLGLMIPVTKACENDICNMQNLACI